MHQHFQLGSTCDLMSRFKALVGSSVLIKESIIFHAIKVDNYKLWEKYFKSLWGSRGYQVANEIYRLGAELALCSVSQRLGMDVDLSRDFISFKKASLAEMFLEGEKVHY